jgi:hypothetical protein
MHNNEYEKKSRTPVPAADGSGDLGYGLRKK